jgi:hypothetical protein
MADTFTQQELDIINDLDTLSSDEIIAKYSIVGSTEELEAMLKMAKALKSMM